MSPLKSNILGDNNVEITAREARIYSFAPKLPQLRVLTLFRLRLGAVSDFKLE